MTKDKLHRSKKFVSAIIEEMKPSMEELMKDKRALEVMKNVIFDEPGERYMGRILPSKEKSLRRIFSGFYEIHASFEVLNDIPIYIKRFPSSNSNASKVRFLKYHIGNYLNENYILRERLAAFQKVITRMYKKDRRLAEMGKQVDQLGVLVSGFDDIVGMRGKHVHEKRYHDEDFERLDFFETMANKNDPLLAILGELYPLALRDYRRKWLKIISENNENIGKILDLYFEILYDVVFDKDGRFVSPNSA